jgi:alpha-L-fucosidase
MGDGRIEMKSEKETGMDWSESTRRSFLKQFGAAGAAALAVTKAEGLGMGAQAPAAAGAQAGQSAPTATDQKQIATREARMAWWHEAKFGMFIHWGLYSIIGQHEWVKEHEGVPIPQYEILANRSTW